MTYKATVTTAQLKALTQRVMAAGSIDEAIAIVDRFGKRLPRVRQRGTWGYWFKRFVANWQTGKLPHSIFAKGNGKLPFYAFSALPEFTCPGAGDCLKWCYSFRAWRYPAAYLRQLQNTLLLLHDPDAVAQAYLALPPGRDVRLYVDGDFESSERVAFWMGLCGQREDLRNYGYSKSWAQLLEYGLSGRPWPSNYTLNVSSGSKWEAHPHYRQAIEALPITRGQFVAVQIDGAGLPKGEARYKLPEYHARVRDALKSQYGKRSFSCPGKCGDCGAGDAMCASRRADNLVIGIGIH